MTRLVTIAAVVTGTLAAAAFLTAPWVTGAKGWTTDGKVIFDAIVLAIVTVVLVAMRRGL